MEKSNNQTPQSYNIKLLQLNKKLKQKGIQSPFKLDNNAKTIIKKGKKIHSKYLKLLSVYNLPPKLVELIISSKQQHHQNLKIQAQQKKNKKNVALPLINIEPEQLLPFDTSVIKPALQKYIQILQNRAVNFENASNKFTNNNDLTNFYCTHFQNLLDMNQINKFNRYIKQGMRIKNLAEKKLNQQKLSPLVLKTLVKYLTKKESLLKKLKKVKKLKKIKKLKKAKKTKNKKINKLLKKFKLLKKSRPTFSVFKKITTSFYKNKLNNLASIVDIKPPVVEKIVKKVVSVYKPKPLLPWIAQGRENYKANKKLILKLRVALKVNRKFTLTREDKKLIKKFKKSFKFSKYGRYGPFSKFTRNLIAKPKKKIVVVKHLHKYKIKRQSLYLQHKRLSSINNITILPQRYMCILIIIWYLSINLNLFLYKIMLKKEIWLNIFFKNIWVTQSQFQTNNFYLNYAINHGNNALITNATIYNPSRNALYYELKPLNNYQRLTINFFNKRQGLHKHSKHLFKPKRKSRVRTFFHLSPKLKNKGNYELKKKFGKKIKKNKSKKLEDQEWLFVTKFTRRKYQHQFNSIFSQLKNIKKIQTYIEKPQPSWHHSYIIANPYYYTHRYKTFVYEMPYKQ